MSRQLPGPIWIEVVIFFIIVIVLIFFDPFKKIFNTIIPYVLNKFTFYIILPIVVIGCFVKISLTNSREKYRKVYYEYIDIYKKDVNLIESECRILAEKAAKKSQRISFLLYLLFFLIIVPSFIFLVVYTFTR